MLKSLKIYLFKINPSLNSHSKSLNVMQKQGKSAQCAANSVHFLAGKNYSDKSTNGSKLRMIKSGSLFARSTWSISNQNIINCLYDQGTFIEDTFNQLPIQSEIEVIHVIGLVIMQIVENTQAERDAPIFQQIIFCPFYLMSSSKSLDESLQKLFPCI